MNIKRAKAEIKNTIEAYLLKDAYGEYVIPQIRQRPVLLLGAPGIGKTQIMEQITKECGIGLVAYTITHHTRQSAIGLPFVSKQTFGGKEYTVTEYTMSEIVASVYEKMEKTGLKEGILFIDEINCASETLAPAMLQFLQCKTFGSHEIPRGWIIVAAGNPPEYNKSVREFDVVTMDRVKKIEVEPDFEVWKEYAIREQLHPAVIAYLTARPGNFYRMETTVDGRKFATPRGWEDLSQMLVVYEQLGKEMDREVAAQYVQYEMIAKDFANYLELYRKYQMDYQLDAVLSGTIDPILIKKAGHASFDERLSVVSLLLSRCRNRFAEVIRQEQMTELLYENLKVLKERLAGDSQGLSGSRGQTDMLRKESDQNELAKPYLYPEMPYQCMDERIHELEAQLEQQRQAELLTRQKERNYRQVISILEDYRLRLQKENVDDGRTAFENIRQWFEAHQDALESELGNAGDMLEHAFDFMEAAFGSGQEMVIFITELNTDFYSVKFLQEYECERYYYYNKELLFEDSVRKIEARLK